MNDLVEIVAEPIPGLSASALKLLEDRLKFPYFARTYSMFS